MLDRRPGMCYNIHIGRIRALGAASQQRSCCEHKKAPFRGLCLARSEDLGNAALKIRYARLFVFSVMAMASGL